MAVYVDDARLPFGRMLMCHMVADTVEELHQMAARIGVARKWFQKPTTRPHYDICLSKRTLALSFGAVAVEGERIVEICRTCLSAEVKP